MKPLDVLKQSRVYSAMDPHHQEVLSRIATFQTFDADHTLVRQGSRNNHIFVISFGEVRVLKKLPAGVEEEVVRLGAGATIGEMGFLDNSPRATSVETVEHTEVLVIDGDKLGALLDKDTALRADFYQVVSGMLVRRLRSIMEDVVTLRTILKKH